MHLKAYIYLFLLLFFVPLKAQNEIWTPQTNDLFKTYPFLNHEANVISNAEALKNVYTKLSALKKGELDKVVFVHIGDSHIQADMSTAVVRKEFQSYFGNAGRGLVFPYQVVKTNAPNDLQFSSSSLWKGNRLAKKDSIPLCGVSGFGMISQQENPEFTFNFKGNPTEKETFDHIKLFLGLKNAPFVLKNTSEAPELIEMQVSSEFMSFDFKNPTSGFTMQFATKDTIPFYGLSLEKKHEKGILYHAIGVNGAKYSDYSKTPLFWTQLNHLNADCYILSLGTNEAQNPGLTDAQFLEQISTTIQQLRSVSPNAGILITTPPVSFYKKHKPNKKLVLLTKTIQEFCKANQVAYWDLFEICNGLKGAYQWKTKKYLRSDLVHFSKEGYELQGHLLTEAFIAWWNQNQSQTH